MPLDRPQHHVPAAAVAQADMAQVPFQFTRVHQAGEDELGEDAVPEVRVPLGRHQGVQSVRRYEEPAHPERGREQFGDAARVADRLGQQ
jgi:hypothetical protein